LAALGHEQQLAVEVEDLDAVAAAFDDAAIERLALAQPGRAPGDQALEVFRRAVGLYSGEPERQVLNHPPHAIAFFRRLELPATRCPRHYRRLIAEGNRQERDLSHRARKRDAFA
jgi:hypothetical protein